MRVLALAELMARWKALVWINALPCVDSHCAGLWPAWCYAASNDNEWDARVDGWVAAHR